MQSIVSYPDRGVGGKSSYRGNCSPRLIHDLIDQFGIQDISDYMCGSGTTEDVARQRGITSHCYDLNRGFDLLTMDIPERNNFIFWHPPYGDMVVYAGSQYSAKEVKEKYGIDPIKSDLSHMKDWGQFVEAMNYCMIKQFASLEPGGRIAVLMGDMKRKGKLYSMLCDIVKPGTMENIVIKAQHNCWSDMQTYSGRFIPIIHEYLLICRKDEPLLIPLRMTVTKQADVRDLRAPTWKDVLVSVMRTMHGPATLDEIYHAVEGHGKTQSTKFWQEKIRQTLYVYPNVFCSVKRGAWELATA